MESGDSRRERRDSLELLVKDFLAFSSEQDGDESFD